MQIKATGRAPFFGTASTSAVLVAITSLALALGACTMNETGQRVGSGAVLGAAGGALLGGNTKGAVIGAAAGAAGGYMVDQHAKRGQAESDNARLRQENERLRLEAENQRLRQQTGY
jgi:hypothetical protein